MGATVERGRRLVLAVIFVAITLSINVTILYCVLVGTDRLPIQLVRLGLTIVICVFLYKGVPAARWLAILLYGAGAWTAISNGGIVQLLLSFGYICVAAILVFSPSVSLFFRTQRRS